MRILIDSLGWIGAFEVVLAYVLISAQKMKSESIIYQLLNLTGGILLIINTFYNKAYPSVVVNIIWAGVAIYALLVSKKTSGIK